MSWRRSDMGMNGCPYLAAFDAALNIFDISVGVPSRLWELVLGRFPSFCKSRWLGVLEALLATGDGCYFDCVDDSGALRGNFDVALLAGQEDDERDDDGTSIGSEMLSFWFG